MILRLRPDDAAEQRHDLAVIELFNPEYDSEANTVKYDIVSENGTSIGGLPGEFGQSTLVIDDDGGQFGGVGPRIGVDSSYHIGGGFGVIQ